MKKRILFVFLALVLVVSLAAFAACAKEEEAPPVEEEAPPVEEEAPPVEEEAPPVEEVWEWPDKFVILSQGPTTVAYAMDAAWSALLEQDTGMKCRLVTEEDPVIGRIWIKQHIFQLGTIQGGTTADVLGEGKFATRDLGPWQQHAAWAKIKGGQGYAVWGDSGIKTPHDIKPGMKIIYWSFLVPTGRLWMESVLAWGQVDPEDVTWVPAGNIQAMFTLLQDGRGDVGFGFPSSPPWLELEASPHGLAWIELNAKEDPEGAARFLEVDPSVGFGPYPASGCPSAHGVWMVVSLHSHSVAGDLDTELVYNLVKWFDENYDRYKDAHPWCQHMTTENTMMLAETSFVPLHDGTVKYLEELGLWTPAHEARRQQNIDQLDMYVQAFVKAVEMADEQGVAVDPANEEWLEMWENYKVELNLPPFKMFIGLD